MNDVETATKGHEFGLLKHYYDDNKDDEEAMKLPENIENDDKSRIRVPRGGVEEEEEEVAVPAVCYVCVN